MRRPPFVLPALALVLTLLGGAPAAAQLTWEPQRGSMLPAPQPKTGVVRSAREVWEKRRQAVAEGRLNEVRGGAASGLVETATPPPPAPPTAPSTAFVPPVDVRYVRPPMGPGEPSSIAKLPPSTGPTAPSTSPAPAPEPTPRRSSRSLVSFEQDSIRSVLEAVVGAGYSDDGERPGSGFSPEGLVRYAFSKVGRVPPAGDADALYQGFGVQHGGGWGAFSPGDLLFFSLFSEREKRARLLVAVVVTPEEMVYASFTAKRVVRRAFMNQFWRERFVGARRVFLN